MMAWGSGGRRLYCSFAHWENHWSIDRDFQNFFERCWVTLLWTEFEQKNNFVWIHSEQARNVYVHLEL